MKNIKIYSNTGFHNSEIARKYEARFTQPVRPIRFTETSPYCTLAPAKKLELRVREQDAVKNAWRTPSIAKQGKYIVHFYNTETEGVRYKWSPKTYADIVQHKKYKHARFELSNGETITLEKVLKLYDSYVQRGKLGTAEKLKKHLDEVIDQVSRRRIDTFNKARSENRTAEFKQHRIEYAEAYDADMYKVHREALDKLYPDIRTDEQVLSFGAETYEENPIVAWCEHIDEYYLGEAHAIQFSAGMVQSNNAQQYEYALRTKPGYSWLYKVISIGKAFDVIPKWTEAMFNGQLCLCIYEKDAKELQQVVNWYAGNVELNATDLSDTVTLHHSNGVDTLDVSEYAYYVLKDVYADKSELIASGYDKALQANINYDDYDRLESRDFLCSIYEAEDEDEDEYI